MNEAALIGTTQELQEEYPLNPKNYMQERFDPFKKLFRPNSVDGMTSLVSPMAGEREDKDKEPKAVTNFLQDLVAMRIGNELHHIISNATYFLAAFPLENLVSTDEMITESASVLRVKKEIENEITKLLSWGADIEFEQGMENDFTRALESMVLRYEDLAIEMLSDAIKQRRMSENLISEIAQYLGIIIDKKTHFQRRLLLTQLLKAKSNFIRYGAVIGLENLNDPKAQPDIAKAANNEQFPPLQTEMMEIADILRS